MFATRTLLLGLKPAVALAGACLLTWDLYLRRNPNRRYRVLWESALTVIAFLAFVGWWNFGGLHPGRLYVHHHEFFHYYLGAKYFPELGYTRLYDCVAAVEVRSPRARDVARRWVRDLTTNELKFGIPEAAKTDGCTRQFSEERWQAFAHDVEYFRQQVTEEKWQELAMDHGYNASPVWTLTGWAAANAAPASQRNIAVLAMIDPVLLVAMWGILWWAFGFRVMTVALIWWGTNIPADFAFIGGAFLRQDWLLLTAAGVAFAHRGRMFLSGAALGWAALLRVFPALLIFGLCAKVLVELVHERSLAPVWRRARFALGIVAVCSVLIPLSALPVGDYTRLDDTWQEFIRNTAKHAGSRASNHMGLKAVISFNPGQRARDVANYWMDTPFDSWIEARNATFRERRLLFWGLIVVLTGLIVSAARTQPDWACLALGAFFIPMLLDLSHYYYGFLLVIGLLWARIPLAGIALCLVSAWSGAVAGIWPDEDDRAVLTSLAIILLIPVVTWAARRSAQLDRSTAPTAPTHQPVALD